MANVEEIKTLDDGVELLCNDHKNGARVLATNALRVLQVAISNEDDPGLSTSDLWKRCRAAGYKLKLARPSMAAAITSAVVDGLNAVHNAWQQELGSGWLEGEGSSATGEMRRIADQTLRLQIQKREESNRRLGDAFVDYLRERAASNQGSLSILTLSYSSTLISCLDQALSMLSDVKFSIFVLESRPAMEGAALALTVLQRLQKQGRKNAVEVTIAPDSHVCALAKSTNILVLGADRVSCHGDVSNKMGSLSAAMAVKALSSGQVAVVTETDKIARPESIDEHKDENNSSEEVYAGWPDYVRTSLMSAEASNVSIRNTYFEWIPKQFVDSYITETGAIGVEEVSKISEKKAKLEDILFDKDFVDFVNST